MIIFFFFRVSFNFVYFCLSSMIISSSMFSFFFFFNFFCYQYSFFKFSIIILFCDFFLWGGGRRGQEGGGVYSWYHLRSRQRTISWCAACEKASASLAIRSVRSWRRPRRSPRSFSAWRVFCTSAATVPALAFKLSRFDVPGMWRATPRMPLPVDDSPTVNQTTSFISWDKGGGLDCAGSYRAPRDPGIGHLRRRVLERILLWVAQAFRKRCTTRRSNPSEWTFRCKSTTSAIQCVQRKYNCSDLIKWWMSYIESYTFLPELKHKSIKCR